MDAISFQKMKSTEWLTELELQFVRIDSKLAELKEIKEKKAIDLIKQLESHSELVEPFIVNELNSRRDQLIAQLDVLFKQKIKTDKTFDWTLRLKSADFCVTKVASSLLGFYFYTDEFDIFKKFQYLSFYNLFTEIEINTQIEFFYLEVLNRHKLFAYLKKESLLKILNHKCQELHSIEINSKLTFKSIKCCDTRIAALFQHSLNKKYYLIVYDEYLNIVSFRSFDLGLSLCSFNSAEVICWHWNKRKCVIFDHKLNITAEIGQDSSTAEPFYLCDSIKNTGTLLDVSEEKMLFYFSKFSNGSDLEQHHEIKIINRKSGLLDGTINIPSNYLSKLIRFDSRSNILMKSFPDNMMNFYDQNGKLLINRTTPQFTDLIRFDLKKNDVIVCYNRNQNKIVFF